MLVAEPVPFACHRLGGAFAVAALHALVLAVLIAFGADRSPATGPRAVEVRLIAAPSPQRAEPTLPTLVPVLRPPPLLPLPPLPEIAIDVPVATITLPAAPAAGSPSPAATSAPGVASAREAPGAHTAADPVHIQHIEYAHFEPPVYPPLSRRLGEQGLVVVRVQIDERGLPVAVAVSVSSGFARLDEAAVRAVRAARFRPYIEGNRARAAYALVPIRFDLT